MKEQRLDGNQTFVQRVKITFAREVNFMFLFINSKTFFSLISLDTCGFTATEVMEEKGYISHTEDSVGHCSTAAFSKRV